MKRLTREEKKDKAIVDIINQMFVIAGHDVTYDDIRGVDKWFQKYTMTFEQGEQLKEWGKQYLMRELNMRAVYAEKAVSYTHLTLPTKRIV